MEETIVKVDHLSHRYSVQWAIRDINFEVPKHGIYGLLGSNGAGKSTTMNIMCGVLRQSEGDVYIKGISMSKNPVEAKRHIGFLPQNPPLHMDLTVTEYLEYCAALRYIPDREIPQAVKKVLEIFPGDINREWVLPRLLYIIRTLWCWMSRPMGSTRIRFWMCAI